MKHGQRLRNLLTGAGRLFDFSRSYEHHFLGKRFRIPGGQRDTAALASDWGKVSESLNRALKRMGSFHAD